MCLMKLLIPTNLVDQSLLTRFHMETMGCFTIEQLHQWRFVTVYYRHFQPDRLKSRKYQINSRGMLARVLAVTHIQTPKVVSSESFEH